MHCIPVVSKEIAAVASDAFPVLSMTFLGMKVEPNLHNYFFGRVTSSVDLTLAGAELLLLVGGLNQQGQPIPPMLSVVLLEERADSAAERRALLVLTRVLEGLIIRRCGPSPWVNVVTRTSSADSEASGTTKSSSLTAGRR